MAAKLILAFASALLVQTISGQTTNAGEIDITNIGVTGNGIGLANNGNSGYATGLPGKTNAGVIDITNIGVAGNGIGLANNGGNGNIGVIGNGIGLSNGIGLANNGGYGNIGVIGNGIGLANNGGYGNIGVIGNGIGLANGIGYGSVSNCGYSGPGISYGFGNGFGANSNGGAFSVYSSSPLAPTGLAVVSENAIDGAVNVNGAVPFLSAVALEGQVSSGGSAGVQYSCGNGNVGIVSENANVGASNVGYGAGLGYGAGYGFGAPLGGFVGPAVVGNYGPSCGCNGAY